MHFEPWGFLAFKSEESILDLHHLQTSVEERIAALRIFGRWLVLIFCEKRMTAYSERFLQLYIDIVSTQRPLSRTYWHGYVHFAYFIGQAIM